MAVIDLSTAVGPVPAFDQQSVYIRLNWNTLWFKINHLYCDWATWSMGGLQINRAQLQWRYGVGMRAGESAFTTIGRVLGAPGSVDSLLNTQVRIDFGDPLNPWRWVGTIESIGDNMEGGSQGELLFNCLGIEYSLDRHVILNSEIQRDSSLTQATVERGITFNYRGRGNRSQLMSGPTYIFGYDSPLTPSDNSARWTTRQIVEYLLEYQTSESSVQAPINWGLNPAHASFLPNYDAPELTQHFRRTSDLLDNLITRERFMAWWPSYDLGLNKMFVNVCSFTDTPIDLGGGFSIPANTNVDDILLENDAAATNVLRTADQLDRVDQVVVQGARRTTTFTIENSRDGTAAAGWTPAEESQYNNGASGWANYPANPAKIDTRRRLNTEARSTDTVSKVYRDIGLPEDWDRLAGDGIGGEKQPVLPIDGDPLTPAELFAKEAYLATNLALLKGRDYSGNNISQGTFKSHYRKPHEPLQPFALALLPEERPKSDANRIWVFSDKLGLMSEMPLLWSYIDREFSVRVRVMPESTTLRLEVEGVDYQHVIAKNQFTGLPEDNWEGPAEFDWREWIMTVTLVEDRHAEFRYPSSIPSTFAVRRVVVNAGEAYRRDYVVPNTVVDVDDSSGHLVRTTSGGYVLDDTPRMEAVARAAYAWYGVARKTISFNTVFRSPANTIGLGRYIDTIDTGANQQTIGSVVTELKLTHDEADEGQVANNAVLSVKTGFADIDPQAFLPAFGT